MKKKSFLNNLGLLFSAREKVLDNFKSRLFPIKNLYKIPTREPATDPAKEPTPTKHKKSKSKSQEEFTNEIIDDKKNRSNQIFLGYFKYQNPSFLVKDVSSAKQNKNEKLLTNINNGLTDLRNDINRKEIPENENPKKLADIVEKIVDFNKQQRGKGLPSDLASVA